uniref:EGF-like domain-containing protein n=1 Tax=Gasterosteus aculeatus aculeatus TaxID=481459 RepID=A0AAQ4PWC5_GASAC
MFVGRLHLAVFSQHEPVGGGRGPEGLRSRQRHQPGRRRLLHLRDRRLTGQLPLRPLVESDSRWRCARPVSTILCVHRRRCRPEDCGRRRVCAADGCVCDAGWRGENCSLECLPGFYGDGCNQTCACVNGAACDPVRGRCACPPGFHGDTCEHACPLGFFGPSCANECRCDDQCPCDPQTGSCNATLRGESNRTLHTAGRCLAKQMFIRWRRDEAARGPRLTERTWLTITSTLASLLLASLLLHLVRGCGGAVAAAAARRPGRRGDYSYVPLVSLNGATQDDPDSQEEIWSPGTSSGKSPPRREGQIFADQRCGRPDLQQEEQNSGASGSAELVNHQEPWKDFPPHAPSNEKHLVGL